MRRLQFVYVGDPGRLSNPQVGVFDQLPAD
jgi:hypothetical protein